MDSYTFVRPDDNRGWRIWSKESLFEDFEIGHSIQVSESCNPNFLLYGRPCNYITNFCNTPVNSLLTYGNWNINGLYETALQCPQCGCGAEGAANLNDLYAAEQDGSRKVSDVANTLFNELLQ